MSLPVEFDIWLKILGIEVIRQKGMFNFTYNIVHSTKQICLCCKLVIYNTFYDRYISHCNLVQFEVKYFVRSFDRVEKSCFPLRPVRA